MNKLKTYKFFKWIFLCLAITTYLATTFFLIFDFDATLIIILYTIGSIFLLLFATFYILQVKLEENEINPGANKQQEKKIKPIRNSKPIKAKEQKVKSNEKSEQTIIAKPKTQALEINQTQQVIQKEKLTKQKVKLETPNNKTTKKKSSLKIIYYIFLVLSIINLVIGLILLNIPLLYMLVIPIISTFFTLSIVTYLIAKNIKNKINLNAIIDTIKNQNRE